MPPPTRCPLSLALEIIGDRWSLLIVRDLMFSDHRHFLGLRANNAERISRSVLAQRLDHLVAHGLVVSRRDRLHLQRVEYRLTRRGIRLLPVIVSLVYWKLVAADSSGLEGIDLVMRRRILKLAAGARICSRRSWTSCTPSTRRCRVSPAIEDERCRSTGLC